MRVWCKLVGFGGLGAGVRGRTIDVQHGTCRRKVMETGGYRECSGKNREECYDYFRSYAQAWKSELSHKGGEQEFRTLESKGARRRGGGRAERERYIQSHHINDQAQLMIMIHDDKKFVREKRPQTLYYFPGFWIKAKKKVINFFWKKISPESPPPFFLVGVDTFLHCGCLVCLFRHI